MSEASEGPGADIIYELFNLYATWSPCGRIGGVRFSGVKQLLVELDLLEGVPKGLTDEYVRQHMLRADQDKDGLLSCQEFMVWFFTEVAAGLPFKRNGANYHAGAPLYNRFVYYELIDSGVGVRRKASGLPLTNFLKMCQDMGISDDAAMLRNVVQVACKQAISDRTQGKLEGGTRLQFAQFMRALTHIAAKKRVALDAVIYRIIGDGSPPPLLQGGKGSNKTYRHQMLEHVIPMFIESDLEAPLRWTQHECAQCGQQHSRWCISDPTIMQAYFRAIGVPYLPHFSHVSTRNVRAVFHRYCLKLNKGIKPPSSASEQPEEGEEAGAAGKEGAGDFPDGQGDESYQDEEQEAELPDGGWRQGSEAGSSVRVPQDTGGRKPGSARDVGGPEEGSSEQEDDIWAANQAGPCCCMYRQMALMEYQTWWKLCMDNATIRSAAVTQGSPLTPARVEAAFMACCSIGGVYCGDMSAGIHDRQLGPGGALASPRMGGLGSAAGRGSGLLRPATYGTPFDGATTLASTTARLPSASVLMGTGGMGGSRPTSASVGPSASGTPWSPAALQLNAHASKGSKTHRPPTPTLNFIQFLEAIRMVAEDLVGHPQVLVNVEVALWSILRDMVSVGCPLPPNKQPQMFKAKSGQPWP